MGVFHDKTPKNLMKRVSILWFCPLYPILSFFIKPIDTLSNQLASTSYCYLILSWFMTRFESRGAHGCGEQWNARDTRVYTDSGLCEDKNPASCMRQSYYDCLGWDPLYPSFYKLRGGGRVYMEDLVSYGSTWPRLYLYLPYLLFYSYLLNHLDYGPPGPCP
jgi:hypothetical protein